MITYSQCSSPVYMSADHSAIKLAVKFDHLESEVGFVATATDIEPHGVQLFNEAKAGKYGVVAEYVAPEPVVLTFAQKAAALKTSVSTSLDAKAVELGFESFAEALTYCDEPAVAEFQQSALKLRAWRSIVWKWYGDFIALGKDFVVAEAVKEIPAFV